MTTASTPAPDPVQASYSCKICNTTYSRLDHLRRHRMTHHEQKTVTCEFCGAQYFRQDILRRHYTTCKSRNDRPMPSCRKKGRRMKACDRCALYKSACNYERPCRTCIDSNSTCTFERLHAAEIQPQPPPTAAPSVATIELSFQPEVQQSEVQQKDVQQPDVQEIVVATSPSGSVGKNSSSATDRALVGLESIESISVPFLLDYTSSEYRSMQYVFGFSSTPPDDLPGLAELSAVVSDIDVGSEPSSSYDAPGITGQLMQPGNNGEHDFPSDIHELLDLTSWNPLSPDGSLSLGQICVPGTFDDVMSSQFLPNPGVASAPLNSQSMVGLDVKPRTNQPSDQALLEVEHIQQFFTTANLQSALSAYFHHYQPHCPILHPHSFNPQTISSKLLLALFFAGTVFSSAQVNLKLVHDNLHLAGKLVLGSLAFREMMTRTLRDTPEAQREYLEVLQAAVILSTLENNEGSPEAQKRVRTITYPRIALCARNLQLLSARNSFFDAEPSTAANFDWDEFLLCESRLRLMQVICWMDFEFCVLHGIPAQFSLDEINAEMPCADEIFYAPTRIICWEKLCGKGVGRRPTLRFVMKALLSETWDNNTTEMIANLGTPSLFTIISAIIELKWTSRGNFLDTLVNKHVEDAVSRWRMAWELHHKRLPPQQARRLGFVKHSLEMWWLVKIIMRVVKQDDDDIVSAPGNTGNSQDRFRDVQAVIKKFGRY
ncbi:hypothetical protein BKA56DRAFT_728966 [Ilyonectria sp. MPI-CAGE-AT-0026]|nr:hypothetical protein BKA56DRAFT_728966 [Ilyonectria sp. MPI-CAGE-AT-0026]